MRILGFELNRRLHDICDNPLASLGPSQRGQFFHPVAFGSEHGRPQPNSVRRIRQAR